MTVNHRVLGSSPSVRVSRVGKLVKQGPITLKGRFDSCTLGIVKLIVAWPRGSMYHGEEQAEWEDSQDEKCPVSPDGPKQILSCLGNSMRHAGRDSSKIPLEGEGVGNIASAL